MTFCTLPTDPQTPLDTGSAPPTRFDLIRHLPMDVPTCPAARPLAAHPNIAPTHTATFTSSMTLYPHAIVENLLDGLPLLTTMVTAFARVVDYRT